ncbi:MAG: hypothetical protein ACRC6R_03805, partial [Bacteroidales bacterium]
MRSTLHRVIIVFLTMACSYGQLNSSICSKQIKAFYLSYMNISWSDNISRELLLREHINSGLAKRMDRISYATGSDPIIRAQDISDDGKETLRVDELGDDWYMVSYLWNKSDSSSLVSIPLKSKLSDGQCKISYITPIWLGTEYGDNILVDLSDSIGNVDQSNGELQFLREFYREYLSIYCSITPELESKLSTLKKEYLSDNAIEQIKREENDRIIDGSPGYDPLIKNFDFDSQWCNSVKFEELPNGNYSMRYVVGRRTLKVTLSISYEDGTYTIDSIQ